MNKKIVIISLIFLIIVLAITIGFLTNLSKMNKSSPSATSSTTTSFVNLTFVPTTVYNPHPLVNSSSSFIISSGILNTSGIVKAYVILNLSKTKVGDYFYIYIPINKRAEVQNALYKNPLVKVAITNNTVYTDYGSKYLSFDIEVNLISINSTGSGGATSLISPINVNGKESYYITNVNATSTLTSDATLYVTFYYNYAENPTEYELEFCVGP
ncbi:hypothetical protein SJAV_20360 [Sulfurisphaera javensis]|uniref:Uncharacterized protein n=1 Tax=Sulfurisphaera javensis TaxID=2049879 RepID=A0AAT9GU23_9CREN